jgi:hypothetical protein
MLHLPFGNIVEGSELAGEPKNGYRGKKTYRMFLGLMIKHQRVQINPVAVRARF